MALVRAIQATSRNSDRGESADPQSTDCRAQIGTQVIPEKSQLERWPEWMDLKAVQAYANVSDRTLRDWLHLPVNPLPASQVAGGKIRVKRDRLDRWMEAHPYQPINSIDVGRITDEIIYQFRKAA
jgi:excisionase family DNA binding protein